MPNCFQLTRKSNLEAGPVVLQKLDDEIREHFNAPPDADHWFFGWYDYIGFMLALGKTFAWLREEAEKDIAEGMGAQDQRRVAHWQQMLLIIDWLDANFTPDAWAEIGKR